MGIMAEVDALAREYIRESFDVDWNRFDDIHRAAAYELYYGPMGSEYWDHVEPLDYYEWVSWNKAVEDLGEMIEHLPESIFYNMMTGEFLLSSRHQSDDGEDVSFEFYDFNDLLEIPVTATIVNHELVRYI